MVTFSILQQDLNRDVVRIDAIDAQSLDTIRVSPQPLFPFASGQLAKSHASSVYGRAGKTGVISFS